MAQTEERKRLLWKGKISGWEKREWFGSNYPSVDKQIGISYRWASDKSSERFLNIESHGNPVYDSFESGIQMPDGTWWFVGDRGREKGKHRPEFEIIQIGATLAMKYIFTTHEPIIRPIMDAEELATCECIGNIHEEATNGKD